MHAITICTSDYLLHSRRLVTSFLKYHAGAAISVYCDDAERASRVLSQPRCKVVELPSIRSVGVKRAKFEAYELAIKQGAFLYLDSDVIDLADLTDLCDEQHLVVSADDLSQCDFIENRRFPWRGDPLLEARVYFNSGVFFAPACLLGFFSRLRELAANDVLWEKYTIEGKLLDNHFLCAFVNLQNIPVRYVDNRQYNWQGFRIRDRIAVCVRKGELLNTETNLPLKLVHFAGIQDIDSFLLTLDQDVLAALALAASEGEPDILQLFRRSLHNRSDLAFDAMKVIAGTAFGVPLMSEPDFSANRPRPYIPNAAALVSLALSEKESSVIWNGLRCGGAYLNAHEYWGVRELLRRYEIQSLLEIGAGHSSVLFSREVEKVLSIEANEGPWLDFAREHGCDVEQVEFDPVTMRFQRDQLLSALVARKLQNVDLVFIDSPIGTRNRKGVFAQIQDLVSAKYLLFHDAKRDAEILFEAAERFGYRVLNFLPSMRGLALLTAADDVNAHQGIFSASSADPRAGRFQFRIEIQEWTLRREKTADGWLCRVRFENTGDQVCPADGKYGLFISYHVVDSNNAPISFDNVRTPLPCNICPGDEVVFDVLIDRLDYSRQCYLYFDLVCEGQFWVSQFMDSVAERFAFCQ